jgi:hypothetical protein
VLVLGEGFRGGWRWVSGDGWGKGWRGIFFDLMIEIRAGRNFKFLVLM